MQVLAFAGLLACSGILVGKDVSTTGRVLFGHNEDDGGRLFVRHHLVPACDWPVGVRIRWDERFAAVPQPAKTLGYFWTEVVGATSADAFYNECGVMIASDSGGKTKVNDGELVDGGVLFAVRRAVAERAHTAREGVRVIAGLVEKYGYAQPGRIYLIADRDEAWAMQVLRGHHWAAQRCPDDAVVFVPNNLTIGMLPDRPTDDILFSAGIREYAEKNGWWTRGQPFDFAAVFQGPSCRRNPHNTFRSRYVLERLTGRTFPGDDFPFAAKPQAKVSPAALTQALSAHPPVEPRHTNDFHSASVCRQNTIESLVCEFAATPAETTLHLAPKHACERGYTAFRPFRDAIPDFGEAKPDDNGIVEFVRYGTVDKTSEGDLYLPKRVTDDTPVALLIHGGGWTHMDRYAVAGIAEWLQKELGFAVYNVDYRLANPAHPWPACGEDCVTAAKFVLGGGLARWGVRPKKILVIGGSAGGHLTLWTALSLPVEQVAGAVVISGIGDPRPDCVRNPKRYEGLFAAKPTDALFDSMDARKLIRPKGPAILMTHASDDTVVPIASARAFETAYRAAGNPVEFVMYSSADEPNEGGHCIWRPGSSPHRLLEHLEATIARWLWNRRLVPGKPATTTLWRPNPRFSFLHDAAIAAFDGKLFTAWYNSAKGEMKGETQIAGRISPDGGRTWGEVKTFASDPSGQKLYVPPAFLNDGRDLWLFYSQMSGPDLVQGVVARRWDKARETFVEAAHVDVPFLPNTSGQRLDDGRWMFGGRAAPAFGRKPQRPAVLISETADPAGRWHVREIAGETYVVDGKTSAFDCPETALVAEDGVWTAFVRTHGATPDGCQSLRYRSVDCGETWTGPFPAGVRLEQVKATAGTFSDGRHYLLGNEQTWPKRPRDRLALWLAAKGTLDFRPAAVLRDGFDPALGCRGPWHYPAAVEADGRLHVVFTGGRRQALYVSFDTKDLK